MLKNNNDYQLGTQRQEGTDEKDIILKSRDQELVFERGNDDDEPTSDKFTSNKQKTIEEINNDFSGAKEGDVNML